MGVFLYGKNLCHVFSISTAYIIEAKVKSKGVIFPYLGMYLKVEEEETGSVEWDISICVLVCIIPNVNVAIEIWYFPGGELMKIFSVFQLHLF